MKAQKSPCEIAVWYVLPKIRAEIAKELMKLGLPQKEISECLGITQSAVSFYVNSKRGSAIPISDEVHGSIKALSRDIIDNKDVDINAKICEICGIIKGEGGICKPLSK
jgi:predicted transcriptional regulator